LVSMSHAYLNIGRSEDALVQGSNVHDIHVINDVTLS
jgi:hypothetical protein